MSAVVEAVRRRLFEMQDPEYRAFTCKLTPSVQPERVIGVCTPQLRAYARELGRTAVAAQFMTCLPHEYHEENNLHSFLIEQIRDYSACIDALNAFLPCVDNWATCDCMSPGVFKKHPQELLEQVKLWLASGQTYTVRFAIKVLMSDFLDERFDPAYAELVAAVHSEEYYVNMMVAWYFATALAKQWDAVLPYIEEKKLNVWIHNKAIQKAVESRRIPEEKKKLLKKMRISGRKAS